jgi:hypothetical protein
MTLSGIMEKIRRDRPVSQREMADALISLEERKLLLSMGGKYLALATYPPHRPLPGKFPELEQPESTMWDWLTELDEDK